MYTKDIEIKGPVTEGYLYFIDKEHPLAIGNSGKVYHHRHMASLYLGRWILPEEHVHHIDRVKHNNAEDNLLVLTASEHSLLHANGGIKNKNCLYCGTTFSPKESSIVYCTPKCFTNSNVKKPELTKEYLDVLIPKYTWTALGRLLGYTDNGIKKRAKQLGCNIPIRKRSSEVEQGPYKAQVEIA